MPQVRICWQCCNYWNDLLLARDNKPVVFLNCDESNVIMDVHKRSGVLVRSGDARGPYFGDETSNPRGSFTILAWISSIPEVQKDLDQFFIVSKKLMSQAAFAALEPLLEESTHLWRLDSAWLNSHVFIACLKAISRSLQRWRERYNFVIVLDCASIHTNVEVLRAARILRLPLVFFPRNSTWLLQPLDTHVFRRLKSQIRILHRAEVLSRRYFRMKLNDAVRHSIVAVQQLLNRRDWSRAFDHNGVTHHQRVVGKRLRKVLQHPEPFAIPSSRPSDEEVASILPRNRTKIPLDLLFVPLAPRPAPRRAPVVELSQHAQLSTSRASNSSPRSQSTNDSHPVDLQPHPDPNPNPPSREGAVTAATLDNPWTHRLRQRTAQNAAICGSDIKRKRSRTPPPGKASSSSDTCQLRRE